MSYDSYDIEKALKDIRSDVDWIKEQTGEKPLTKEEILSIKDRTKRLQAIRENMHLFQHFTETPVEASQRNSQEGQYWSSLSRYGINKANIQDMSTDEILSRVPSGPARVFALKQILGK